MTVVPHRCTTTMHGGKFAVLLGTLDDRNPLSLLRGNALVWSTVFGMVDAWCERHVDLTSVACITVVGALVHCQFPEPRGVVVNMMPIQMGNLHATVPAHLKQYIPMIDRCPVVWNPDRVAYLTVHEGLVPAGGSQRRQGLHIERPGAMATRGFIVPFDPTEGSDWLHLAWGLGRFQTGFDIPIDGIYMASSVADSCRVFPALIEDAHEVADAHGGIEHLRPYVGQGRGLAANELCWFTDRTPHEAVPMEGGGYRQFFRLVVGRISVWHSRHNTSNPCGLQPDAPVSDEDKFAGDPDPP